MGDSGEIADFAELLEYVRRHRGIERIRFTTSHPERVHASADRGLCQAAQAGEPPAPAGAARQRPHPDGHEARLHGTLEYKSTIRKRARGAASRSACPSDFIVGFPGETEDDLQRMLRLIEEIGFDASFSFVFSPRPGTPAASLTTTPPGGQARTPAARQASARRQRGPHQRHAGRQDTAHPGRRTQPQNAAELMGRTECNRIVSFDGGPQSARLVGQLIDPVQVVRHLPHSLRGEGGAARPDTDRLIEPGRRLSRPLPDRRPASCDGWPQHMGQRRKPNPGRRRRPAPSRDRWTCAHRGRSRPTAHQRQRRCGASPAGQPAPTHAGQLAAPDPLAQVAEISLRPRAGATEVQQMPEHIERAQSERQPLMLIKTVPTTGVEDWPEEARIL